MILENPGWLGYFDRTYDQIKTNVLTKFQGLVPEITDHTETNPWVKGISIWSAIAEMLGYYIDSRARELFLTSAKKYSSAVKIAKQYDYRVQGATPAAVTLRFSSNVPASGTINIPVGTKVKTETDVIFTTTTAGVINSGQTFCDVEAMQWEIVPNVALGNSNGQPDQEFILEEDVADGSIALTVSAVAYAEQETLAFSIGTSEHFIAGLNEDTKMVVQFGDGINGKIPPSGQAIVATYYVTQGEAGRVGAGKINQIISAITVPGSEVMSVNNSGNATGGSNFEDLTKLQKRIPLSIRTKYRAVTRQDFIDLAELVAGVERAGVEFDCEVDAFVKVYLAPEGGGVASNSLITAVQNYLDERKIITTKVQTQSAGVAEFLITVEAVALPGFSNTNVTNDIQQALLDFFDPVNQDVEGHLTLGDLYQVIEGVRGVRYSQITLLVVIPFARNIITPTNVLNWDREVKPASVSTLKWLIRFTTNAQFELFKETDFEGVFLVDNLVVMDEIEFTINGTHEPGDQYVFYTYAYNQSVFLAEPSIPSTSIGNMTVTVTGGV